MEMGVAVRKDENGEEFGKWLKKPDIPGICFCVTCGKTIMYKSKT